MEQSSTNEEAQLGQARAGQTPWISELWHPFYTCTRHSVAAACHHVLVYMTKDLTTLALWYLTLGSRVLRLLSRKLVSFHCPRACPTLTLSRTTPGDHIQRLP